MNSDPFLLIFKIFKLCGLWDDEEFSKSYKIYGVFLHLLFSVLPCMHSKMFVGSFKILNYASYSGFANGSSFHI